MKTKLDKVIEENDVIHQYIQLKVYKHYNNLFKIINRYIKRKRHKSYLIQQQGIILPLIMRSNVPLFLD